MKNFKYFLCLVFCTFPLTYLQAQDSFENHQATQTLAINEHEIRDVFNLNIPSGSCNGLRFLNNSNYGISMGKADIYHFEPVTHYP